MVKGGNMKRFLEMDMYKCIRRQNFMPYFLEKGHSQANWQNLTKKYAST